MAVERIVNWHGVPLEVHRTRPCRCGQLVELGFSVRDRVPVVMHREPVCETFRDLDADTFLLWNGWVEHDA